jgi:hypothetical protein
LPKSKQVQGEERKGIQPHERSGVDPTDKKKDAEKKSDANHANTGGGWFIPRFIEVKEQDKNEGGSDKISNTEQHSMLHERNYPHHNQQQETQAQENVQQDNLSQGFTVEVFTDPLEMKKAHSYRSAPAMLLWCTTTK